MTDEEEIVFDFLESTGTKEALLSEIREILDEDELERFPKMTYQEILAEIKENINGYAYCGYFDELIGENRSECEGSPQGWYETAKAEGWL